MRDMDLSHTDKYAGRAGFPGQSDSASADYSHKRQANVAPRENLALSIVRCVLEARQDEQRIETAAKLDGKGLRRRPCHSTTLRTAATAGLINRMMMVSGTSVD